MRPFKSIRRLAAVVSVAALFAAVIAGPAAADGPDPERLAEAGWFCFPHFVTHCLPDGDRVLSGEAATSLIMTWGTDGEFWGTEFLIHEDLYNGQPCPPDTLEGGEPGAYIPLSDLGLPLPYLVCHHFDSPFT